MELVEPRGEVDPEKPATLAGSYTYESDRRGIPTTVTVAWDLRRSLE